MIVFASTLRLNDPSAYGAHVLQVYLIEGEALIIGGALMKTRNTSDHVGCAATRRNDLRKFVALASLALLRVNSWIAFLELTGDPRKHTK